MKKNYNILLVDDHPIITAAYKKILQHLEEEKKEIHFHISEAHELTQAWHVLNKYKEHQVFDMVFIDLRLPPSPELNLLSGEDFALQVKQALPQAKIIIATTFKNNFRIHTIFKTINPDGFLIKNDLTEKEFKHCIEDMLDDSPYYSKSVRNSLRKYVSNNLLVDSLDRKILYYLSLGTKTKDLPEILPLSQPGIERRKRILKEIFDVEQDDDKALLQKARELGFI